MISSGSMAVSSLCAGAIRPFRLHTPLMDSQCSSRHQGSSSHDGIRSLNASGSNLAGVSFQPWRTAGGARCAGTWRRGMHKQNIPHPLAETCLWQTQVLAAVARSQLSPLCRPMAEPEFLQTLLARAFEEDSPTSVQVPFLPVASITSQPFI